MAVKDAKVRFDKIMFGIRASMPYAREDDIKAIGWAIETALENPRVKDALKYYEHKDIIASVAEGVDICI